MPETEQETSRRGLAAVRTQAMLAVSGGTQQRAEALVELVDTMIFQHARGIGRPQEGSLPWLMQEIPYGPETRTDAPTEPGLYWAFYFTQWQVLRIFRRGATGALYVQRHGNSFPDLASTVQTWGPRVPDFVPLNNETNDG